MRKHLTTIGECASEIAALSSVYTNIVSGKVFSDSDLRVKQLESQYAKERILKLSFHIKKQLEHAQRKR